MKRRSLFFFVALFLCGGAPEATTLVVVPRIPSPPIVDGQIGDAEWEYAFQEQGLIGDSDHQLDSRKASFKIATHDGVLYLAIQSKAGPNGSPMARVQDLGSSDAHGVWLDDFVHVGIRVPSDPTDAPDRIDRLGKQDRTYHLVFNRQGAMLDYVQVGDVNRTDWECQGCDLKQQVANGVWTVELSFGLDALFPVTTPVPVKTPVPSLGISLTRGFTRSRHDARRAVWAPDDNGLILQAHLLRDGPIVRADLTGKVSDEVGLELARIWVRNPSVVKRAFKLTLTARSERDGSLRRQRVRMTLAPDEQESRSLTADGSGWRDGRVVSALLTDAVNGQVLYRRSLSIPPGNRAPPWQVDPELSGLRYKFYPYSNRLLLNLRHHGVTAPPPRSEGVVSIHAEDGEDPIWRSSIRLSDGAYDGILDIPDLADGSYRLEVDLQDTAMIGIPPLVRQLERKRFDWEHNDLGMSDEVLPPFTPLVVSDGNRVQAVLREHVHGRNGLWNEVTSQGAPLLTGPVSLAAIADGAEIPVSLEDWQVSEASPTHVRGRADLKVGDEVVGYLENEYDIDGMLWNELHLLPSAPPLDRLSLIIPLRSERASYMHAATDLLRTNHAGKVPEKKPDDDSLVVWTSHPTQVRSTNPSDRSGLYRHELRGQFVPYIWIGDGERGICWFADSPQGMRLDPSTPMLEISRSADGSTTELKAHLITATAEGERTISFGLQATPVKPMPEGWRTWTANKPMGENSRPVRLLTSNWYWGGEDHSFYPFGEDHSVYPLEEDYPFFAELLQAREKWVDEATVEAFAFKWADRWCTRYPAKCDDRRLARCEHYREGLNRARNCRLDDGCRLIPYTNPRGINVTAPAFETFRDEWTMAPWHGGWERLGNHAYDLAPVGSFQDYILWYAQKMLPTFDGIYYDNLFLYPGYDRVAGGASLDDEGRIAPNLGIRQLRSLMRRTAYMLHRRWQDTSEDSASGSPRPEPLIVAHMTNANIVPVLSFANVTLDWEDKQDPALDFQARFPADLTVAQSIGRQVGAWPTVLDGKVVDLYLLERGGERWKWLARNRLGVALVHELQVFHDEWDFKEDIAIYKELFAAGYGTERCTVSNYWHHDHPIGLTGIEAKTLSIRCPEALYVVVTSYQNAEAEATMTLDLDVLGLSPTATAKRLDLGRACQPQTETATDPYSDPDSELKPDPWTVDSITRTGNGIFNLSLPAHDFMLLRVQ